MAPTNDAAEVATNMPPVEADPPPERHRIDRWLDRWPGHLVERMPEVGRHHPATDVLRVEEYVDADETLVIRVEAPGVDPDDIELDLDRGQLSIRVTRTEQESDEQRRVVRSEFHYGAFTRHLSLPSGVEAADITADYRDGILEVRVPAAGEAHRPTRIAVTRRG